MLRPIFMVILVFFLNMSCATAQMQHGYLNPNTIEEEFHPYIEHFVMLSNGVVDIDDFSNVDMRFDNLEGNTVGTCLPAPWAKEIRIDRNWWSNHSQAEKEQLVFHEFGHCILMRMHTEEAKDKTWAHWVESILMKLGLIKKKGYLEDGCPASYMHPYTLDEDCINKHYQHYIDELFDNTAVLYEEETVVIEEFYYDNSSERINTRRTCH